MENNDSVILVAKSPDEMLLAQARSVEFMERKVVEEQSELTLKQANLEAAKTAKVKASGWQREVQKQTKRVLYYTKVLAALKEGYCIVPDFPVGLIAIRTDQKQVRGQTVKRWGRGILDLVPKELPAGEGRYVNPEPDMVSFEKETVSKDGTVSTQEMLQTTGHFQEVDLPIRLVRPEVITELNKALTDKIFDEIGILPNTVRKMRQDPMIVGRIKGAGRSATFLITWWIDPRSV